MTEPHRWYPVARALQRRIIYHGGPTNSGECPLPLKLYLSPACPASYPDCLLSWQHRISRLNPAPPAAGKTYNAMQALKVAQSGVYCGPLRLLVSRWRTSPVQPPLPFRAHDMLRCPTVPWIYPLPLCFPPAWNLWPDVPPPRLYPGQPAFGISGPLPPSFSFSSALPSRSRTPPNG